MFVSSLNNAGQLEVYGAETEVLWLATENSAINLNAAYIDSEFKDLTYIDFGVFNDFTGNTTEYTPELSFSGSYRYDRPLASGATFNLQINATWSDDVFFGLENNPQTVREALWLLDASIGYTTADGAWNFQLWGKNLSDEEYFSGGFDIASSGVNLMNVADPRVIGVSARYQF